jgi:hypothetical protein
VTVIKIWFRHCATPGRGSLIMHIHKKNQVFFFYSFFIQFKAHFIIFFISFTFTLVIFFQFFSLLFFCAICTSRANKIPRFFTFSSFFIFLIHLIERLFNFNS